jgi:hypothetical protein
VPCVYALGGVNLISGSLNTVEAYSPAANRWETLPPLPTAREFLAAATAPCPEPEYRAGQEKTCVYAIGGRKTGVALSTVEAFAVREHR